MTRPETHFEHDGLLITVEDSPSKTMIRWSGVSDSRDPSIRLIPFFFNLLNWLQQKEVVVDFRGFEYMNSATVAPLINFVKNLDSKGIATTLLFDLSIPWQKVNAQCMRAIARTLSHVQVP